MAGQKREERRHLGAPEQRIAQPWVPKLEKTAGDDRWRTVLLVGATVSGVDAKAASALRWSNRWWDGGHRCSLCAPTRAAASVCQFESQFERTRKCVLERLQSVVNGSGQCTSPPFTIYSFSGGGMD